MSKVGGGVPVEGEHTLELELHANRKIRGKIKREFFIAFCVRRVFFAPVLTRTETKTQFVHN